MEPGADPDGELEGCVGGEVIEITCVLRDDDDGCGGGGGGVGCPPEGCIRGGGDDDDGDDDSQCTEDQKAIAKEYDSLVWPCEKFDNEEVIFGRGTETRSKGISQAITYLAVR